VRDGPQPIAMPNLEPPPGVGLRIGWTVGAMFWRAHVPIGPDSEHCGRCGVAWPCLSVRFADHFLSTLYASDDRTHAVRHTEPIPRL